MSDEINNSKEVSPTVALFQKAHASLVTLQRIDEQLIALSDRRRKVQAELREAQMQLNDEIDRAAAVPADVTMKFPTAASSKRRRIEQEDEEAVAEAA